MENYIPHIRSSDTHIEENTVSSLTKLERIIEYLVENNILHYIGISDDVSRRRGEHDNDYHHILMKYMYSTTTLFADERGREHERRLIRSSSGRTMSCTNIQHSMHSTRIRERHELWFRWLRVARNIFRHELTEEAIDAFLEQEYTVENINRILVRLGEISEDEVYAPKSRRLKEGHHAEPTCRGGSRPPEPDVHIYVLTSFPIPRELL